MASINIGAVGQGDFVRSEFPSLTYDNKGSLTVVLETLSASINAQNAKVLHATRIKVLEANFHDIEAREKGASASSELAILGVVGAVGVSILIPPAAVVAVAAIPLGIKGIVDGHHAGCTGVKRHWLQVELDAEKAFAEQHPEQLADDIARKEFVYNFIYNYDPGYIRTSTSDFGSEWWESNRHIFPEAQAKYDAIAAQKRSPVSMSYGR